MTTSLIETMVGMGAAATILTFVVVLAVTHTAPAWMAGLVIALVLILTTISALKAGETP